ncbi:hypothetical protein EJB05_45561, partial [Eragrostis curvula]
METEAAAAAPSAKKRRTEPHEGRESVAFLSPAPHEPLPPADAPHSGLTRGPEPEGSPGQEPPRGAGGEEEDGVDRIGLLPDAVLGDIISLLPTKDGVRTQILATRWRRLWRSAPLNLDCSGGGLHEDDEVQAGLISRILEAHSGPARRLFVPVLHLHLRPATVDDWLSSAALDNLQELEFDTIGNQYFRRTRDVSLPASAFRFSATLRVVTISRCHISDIAVEALSFPQLQQLGLKRVDISEGSLQNIIAGSPVLEYLLLYCIDGLHTVRINSPSLVSIGLYLPSGNFIIEDAPSLQRLLQIEDRLDVHVSVIRAPKLETLGCLSDYAIESNKYTFGNTILQNLSVVSFTTEMQSVKILAISNFDLNLDTTSDWSGGKNLWRRKHRDLVRCVDIRLKKVVLDNYRGIRSQVNFATFFVLNAKMLELMRFEGRICSDEFIARQHRLLQVEKRASKGAQFHFTKYRECLPHIKHVSDLSKTDPFECGSMCVR